MPTSSSDTPDGHFDLYYHDGWAYLTVYAPQPGGLPIYREDVRNRMKLLRIPRVDASAITDLIEQADGKPHRLVEWPEGRALASIITVAISEDELTATVVISAPRRGALAPTLEDVRLALTAGGVRHGIDDEAIALLLREARYDEETVVARGTPPVHARSGEVTYHFNPDRGKPYLLMEYGRINLKELNFIENKQAGSLLAELADPVEPENGTSVTGRTLTARTDVEPTQFAAGRNTELTDGGRAIHATADGNVKLVDGAVTVEPVVSVESVDYETGNIAFDGAVIVERTIADGFTVEAGGDVQVGHGVGRATIVSGGNVLLKAGISGGGDGRVECGGNLATRYIEGSTVLCGQNVFVEEAIMQSTVHADRHCMLSGRRAEIIASELIVGGSLWCRKLGSVAEALTTVAIGIPPHVLTDYRRTTAELERLGEQIEKINEQMRQIDRSLAHARTDPRLPRAKAQLEAEAGELESAIGEARSNARQLKERLVAWEKSMLVVEDTIYAGAVVYFGRVEWRPPNQGASATVLKHLHGKILESGYNSREPPQLNFEGTPES